jgi:hypothetical protein
MVDNGTIDIVAREKLKAQTPRNSLDQKIKATKCFSKPQEHL